MLHHTERVALSYRINNGRVGGGAGGGLWGCTTQWWRSRLILTAIDKDYDVEPSAKRRRKRVGARKATRGAAAQKVALSA